MASRGRKTGGGGTKSKNTVAAAPKAQPERAGVKRKSSDGRTVTEKPPRVSKPASVAPPAPTDVRREGGNGVKVELPLPAAPAIAPPPSPVPEQDRPSSPHGVAQIADEIPPSAAVANTIEVKTPMTLTSPEAVPVVSPSADAPRPKEQPAVFEAPEDPAGLSTLGSMPALMRPIPMPPSITRPIERERPVPAPPSADTTSPSQKPVAQPALLFEIGWEVCWQLGGIYTVLRSKAATMLKTWGERYCLVGPYNPVTAPVEFEPEEPQGYMAETVKRLRDGGMPCYFGRCKDL